MMMMKKKKMMFMVMQISDLTFMGCQGVMTIIIFDASNTDCDNNFVIVMVILT